MHNPRHDPMKVHRHRAERSSDEALAFWLKYNLLDQREARPYLMEASERILKNQRFIYRLVNAFWVIVVISVGLAIGLGVCLFRVMHY